jgi:Transposase IS116/IS110/IS902 family
MPRMQIGFMKQRFARRCGSFRSNPLSNRICNPFIVRGSAFSALELRSSTICGGFSASMSSSYPKAHGAFWRRRRTPSRPRSFLISRGSSSPTCSMSSVLSISGSTSWISSSWGFVERTKPCRRLSKLPGVGPVIATAIVAAVDGGRHFRSGRELAAWIGLVPRQTEKPGSVGLEGGPITTSDVR